MTYVPKEVEITVSPLDVAKASKTARLSREEQSIETRKVLFDGIKKIGKWLSDFEKKNGKTFTFMKKDDNGDLFEKHILMKDGMSINFQVPRIYYNPEVYEEYEDKMYTYTIYNVMEAPMFEYRDENQKGEKLLACIIHEDDYIDKKWQKICRTPNNSFYYSHLTNNDDKYIPNNDGGFVPQETPLDNIKKASPTMIKGFDKEVMRQLSCIFNPKDCRVKGEGSHPLGGRYEMNEDDTEDSVNEMLKSYIGIMKRFDPVAKKELKRLEQEIPKLKKETRKIREKVINVPI